MTTEDGNTVAAEAFTAEVIAEVLSELSHIPGVDELMNDAPVKAEDAALMIHASFMLGAVEGHRGQLPELVQALVLRLSRAMDNFEPPEIN